MKISVIIPTINRPQLQDALRSVRNQTRAADEIIIEHDEDSELTRRGPAATRNAGARRAHGDVLLFIDDDCVAESHWIERMATAFEDPAVTAVSGAVLYRGANHLPTLNERVVQNPDARWFMGANCGVRRDAFWKLGGFPEKYRVYEDKAFALSCWMKKYLVARAPLAQVYHATSQWDARMVKQFADHLSWWIELMRDFDVWADKNNPPPLWGGHVLMPRDFGAFFKHLARLHDPASRLRAELLMRQRLQLWKRAIRNRMFVV
ncbi:MAG: hypothetical protein A2848_02945 [Candidatus Magasanikbacteria bacterium RIFCSPHIGHO2_01_FULL_50_8]|uniref:Glycosyltransferase 2-like domain-containing protein n=1 Tax=Candidatus Magasanikbacteria bacterium RIFCSPHIGHO2_01_FULL_50_8 TaxID=1798674 RepID=A0A1F6LVU5_9BACT|nr:MAG: hypothetical protein A2848_02945 [Candidatus Magasanikbacteria bacterium RIFCSPHIGHO2_01_FULL_50_8]